MAMHFFSGRFRSVLMTLVLLAVGFFHGAFAGADAQAAIPLATGSGVTVLPTPPMPTRALLSQETCSPFVRAVVSARRRSPAAAASISNSVNIVETEMQCLGAIVK
jgi:hypothetical protein